MNLIQTIEAENIARFLDTKTIPDFRPGDTLKVGVKVVEGERTRVQNYEGVCIARSNRSGRLSRVSASAYAFRQAAIFA